MSEGMSSSKLPELLTATPFEGRLLAIALARKAIYDRQPDKGLRQQQMDCCAFEPAKEQKAAFRKETACCKVYARKMFQEVAKANNYWSKKKTP
ncbi:hexameric tyrosine-coordinated heme protein [Pontibacter flavimaris]|uniref:Uncharacterized protein n=1 Tax=Pontibacter flavimaris TaxID=1797110 RepID=A0A1Q5PE25_9BACT|nr:hexameric tyrosine-coordinated heme protein [Pontibacter flavimaris]OKL40476.1 hypothetical protein A3841_19440 [Pontibacter flavimaris]